MGQLTCSTLLHNSLYICAVRRCASTRTNKPSLRAQKEILRGACGAQFSRPIMWVLRVKPRACARAERQQIITQQGLGELHRTWELPGKDVSFWDLLQRKRSRSQIRM